MADRTGRVITAAVVLLVGAGILIVSIVTPWYTISGTGAGVSIHANFYPGTSSTNGTIRYSCSGANVACPSQSSYSGENANNTGMVAETGFFLLIAGIVVGLLAGLLALLGRNKRGGGGVTIALGVLAVVLAIVAPALFALELPGAVGRDNPGVQGSGPWSSFYGSNVTGGSGGLSISSTWGPGAGWYLAIGAFVVFWIGVILVFRIRREDREFEAPMAKPALKEGVPPPSAPGSDDLSRPPSS